MSTSFERFDAWRRTADSVPLGLNHASGLVTPDPDGDPHLPWRDESADEGFVAYSVEDGGIAIELSQGPTKALHVLDLDEAERIALATLALVAFARTETEVTS